MRRPVTTSKTVRGSLLSAAVAGLALFAGEARAANVYWDGVSGSWTDLVNWSTVSNATTPDPVAIPGISDAAFFNITTVNGAQTVYLNGDQAITGLTFTNTGSTTLLGGLLDAPAVNTLTSGGNITTGSGAVLIGAATSGAAVNVALIANQTWTIGSGGMTVHNAIGGGAALTKAGTGLLILNGANSYSGGTTITGVLRAGSNTALGTGSVTVNTGSGNQLQLGSGVNIANPLTINGGGVVAQGALYVPTGIATYSGPINITANANSGGHFATAGNSSRLIIAGDNTITTSVPITVRNGYVLVSGAQNYATGTTLANAGATIHFARTASMPASGTVALSSGTTLAVNVGGAGEFAAGAGAGTVGGLLAGTGGQGSPVALGTGSSLAIDTTNAPGPITLSDPFTSTNNVGLVKLGTGTLGLSGGGTLGGAGAAGFPLAVRQGTLLINNGLSVSGNAVIGGPYGTGDVAGLEANLQLDSGLLALGTGVTYVGLNAGTGNLTVSGGTLTTGGEVQVAGSNANGAFTGGGGTLTMNGGLATLNALTVSRGTNNQFANNGLVQLNGGTLSSVNDVILGYAGNNNAGIMNINGGTFNVGTTGTKWMMIGWWDSARGELNINSGNLNLNFGSSLKFSRGNNNTGANVINQNGGNITSYSDFATTIGGGGNLDLQQSGTITSNNTYNLNGGTLTIPQVLSSVTTGARTFNFNGGVLRPTGSNANFFNLGAGNAVANVRNGGAIIDTNGHSVTVSQQLAHSNVPGDNAIDGGLTKAGAGSLTLTVNNTYTGPTAVTGGRLVLAEFGDVNTSSGITLNGGGLTQNSGTPVAPTVNLVNGTLDGTGSVNTVVVSNNAANVISNAVGSMLNIGSLTFNGAAAFALNVTGTSPEIVTSSITTNAAGTVVVNAASTLWLPGQYDLVSYGSLGGAGFSRFTKGTIAGLSARQNASLVNTGSAIALNIVGDNPSWSGANDGRWTTAIIPGNKNWKLITAGTPTDYINGDIVLFDDTATGTTTVTISDANVTPTSVTFNNSGLAYTINGPFGIAGATPVTINGGQVTLASPNSYTGGTTLNTGTLNINSATAIGSGTLTIANGTAIDNTSGAPVTLSTNNAQMWNGDFAFNGTNDLNLGTGNVTLSGNRLVVVQGPGILTVGGAISGTGFSLTQVGSGTLRLTGNNTYSGTTIINNGAIEIAGGTTGVTTQNIQISAEGTGTGHLIVSNGQLLANRVIIGGNSANAGMPNSGTLTQTGGTITSQQWFTVGSGGGGNFLTGTFNLSGGTLNVVAQQMEVANFAAAEGIVNMSGGAINIMNNNFISLGANNDAGNGTFNQSGGTVNFFSDNGTTSGGNGVLYLGRAGTLSSTHTYNLDGGTLTVPQIQSNTANSATAVFNFNGGLLRAARSNGNFIQGLDQVNVNPGGARLDTNGFAITINQDLSNGGGGLTKSGAGTLTYTGNGNYSGATSITAGKFVLSGAGHINGSSGINITGGAQFVVNSSTPVAPAVTLTNGALSGSGSLSSVTVASNVANVISNGDGNTNPLTISSLTLEGAATLNFNTNSTAPVLITTSLLTTGAGTVVVNANNASWTTGSTYRFLSFDSIGGSGFSAFTLGSIAGLTPRQSATLINPTGAIGIQITGGNIPVWTGALNGVWTAAAQALPKNWKLQSGGAQTDFLPGDEVLFDDSVVGTTVVDIAEASVAPTSVTFNNANKTYTITSSGGFGISSGFLVKNGGGTVILETNNTYAGGTTLSGGTLVLNNTSSIGTGTLTLAGGTLDSNAAADVTLVTNNATSIIGDFSFAGTRNLNLGSGTVTLGGPAGSRTANIAAGTLGIGAIPVATPGIGLTKTGAGTLLIGGSVVSRIGGPLAINAGTVQVAQDTFVTGLSGSGTLEAVAGKWFFVNNPADYTFSGVIRDGSGALGLNKNGVGSLVLTGNNTYSLATTVQLGTLVFSGNTNNTTQVSQVGTNGTGNGVLVISPLAVFGANWNPGQFTSSLSVGTTAGSAGAIRLMDNGTLTTGSQFGLGTGAGSYAAFTQEGGVATTGSFVVVGFNNDNAAMNIRGGTFTVGSNLITIGAGGANSNGVVTVSGGHLNSTATTGFGPTIGGFFVGETGRGTLNVMGSGLVSASGWAARLGQTATGIGTINLLGGTLSTTAVSKGAGAGSVNFNGGTLRNAGGNNATFMQGIDAATLYAGGAVIDDNNASITIAQPLVGATGNGVSAVGVTASGAGFIDTPLVQVSGDGTGATAIANIDAAGNLTGITITSPGTGYTNASFTLVGGGNGNSGVISGSPTITPNTSGGLTKNGTGTLTLTGASNYSGVTQVNAGTVDFGGAVTHAVGAIRGNAVSIAEGTTVTTATGAGASRLASLTIAGTTGAWTGKLDLANNALILAGTDAAAQAALIATVADQVATARAGGTWTGNGITSSSMADGAFAASNSLAVADAGDLGLTTFGGQTGLDANTTIVTVARNGDATLDRVVDAFDLNILAGNWQTSGKIWSSGDFTGDGIVDAFDLNMLAANWQFGIGGSLQAALAQFPVFGNAVAAVPEPASLAVLVLGSAALMTRRRRRN